GLLEISHVREDPYGAAVLRLALADLDPATVCLGLEKRSTGVAVPSNSFLYPFSRPCDRLGDDAALGHPLDDFFELQPWLVNVSHTGIELAKPGVAQHHAVVSVIEGKAFRDALQRIGQAATRLRRCVARVRQFLGAELERALEQGAIAVEAGIGGIDRVNERPQRVGHLVLYAEVLPQLAPQQAVHRCNSVFGQRRYGHGLVMQAAFAPLAERAELAIRIEASNRRLVTE